MSPRNVNPNNTNMDSQEVKESYFGSSYQTTDKIEIQTVSIEDIEASEDD